MGAVLGYTAFNNLDHFSGNWFRHRGEASTGFSLMIWWAVKLTCTAALGAAVLCIPCLLFVEALALRVNQFKTFFVHLMVIVRAIISGPPGLIFQPPRKLS